MWQWMQWENLLWLFVYKQPCFNANLEVHTVVVLQTIVFYNRCCTEFHNPGDHYLANPGHVTYIVKRYILWSPFIAFAELRRFLFEMALNRFRVMMLIWLGDSTLLFSYLFKQILFWLEVLPQSLQLVSSGDTSLTWHLIEMLNLRR